MIIPLGTRFNQTVHLIIKKDGKLLDKELKPTLFVPMTGKALKEGPEPKPDAGGAPQSDESRPRRKRSGDSAGSRSSGE